MSSRRASGPKAIMTLALGAALTAAACGGSQTEGADPSLIADPPAADRPMSSRSVGGSGSAIPGSRGNSSFNPRCHPSTRPGPRPDYS